ncbi:hypothetical protein D1007_61584 [Hordeum vulgare]|nr:hypothetical protein D1007_61584 [Hordeum vulgare]
MCVSDLVCYIEFLLEEEECLVKHAKCITAAMAAAHAAAEARNLEIYKESRHFEMGHLERKRMFEVSVEPQDFAQEKLHKLKSVTSSSYYDFHNEYEIPFYGTHDHEE